MPDPYTFPPDLAPEESLVVACERCGGVLLTNPCPCGRALPPARPAAKLEACGLDHLIVRPDGLPARERTPQTHGELLFSLVDARAERNLARDDLRAILSRLAVLIEHGERWTPGYLVRCLRELRAECRTALS